MTTLKPGRKAPKFSATIQTGEQVKLEDYRGKKLILFFYPKDNTPTCTVEACNLRDNFSKLKKEGFQLLGVSPDSEKKHNNFINKFDLPFDLIADTDLKVIKAYKCWGLKKFMGREFEGVYRTTFVIDEEGKLELVITKVKSKDHTNQILELLAAV
ncbi:MAG: thioredoxin-dependent thiol peroxidase [Saprospiraceae bacterium]|nr:thioredoxin-dependent thiol peroxidase [Saprospiraceae bacterium]